MIEPVFVSSPEEIRKIFHEEMNKTRKTTQTTGYVNGLEPLAVQTKDGLVHITAAPVGMELANDDWVQIERTSAGAVIVNKLASWDNLGQASLPDHSHTHDHDADYAALVHNHGGWEHIQTVQGTGASPVISLSLPTTYDDFELRGRLGHTSTSNVTARVQFNSDQGNNYDYNRIVYPGGSAPTPTSDGNLALNGLPFWVGGSNGSFQLQVTSRSSSGVHMLGTFRARVTSVIADNRLTVAEAGWNGGPATSIQFRISSNNILSTSYVRLYGIRVP